MALPQMLSIRKLHLVSSVTASQKKNPLPFIKLQPLSPEMSIGCP